METTKHKIASVDEFQDDGSRVIAEVKGTEIAVFRIDGEFHAVANFCPHQGGPICEGELTGYTVGGDDGWSWEYDEQRKNITCPWHGWKFDVTTSRSIVDDRYALPSYDVFVEDGNVYVTR